MFESIILRLWFGQAGKCSLIKFRDFCLEVTKESVKSMSQILLKVLA